MNELFNRFFGFLPAFSIAVGAMFLSRRLMHYFQLESYQFAGYFKTVKRQLRRVMAPLLLYAAAAAALLLLRRVLYINFGMSDGALSRALLGLGISLLCGTAGYYLSLSLRKSREKKPFVKTMRVKRLYAVLFAVLAAAALLLTLFLPMLSAAVPLLLPLLLPLAALLALPIEKAINHLYFIDARKKLLGNERLIRIGITGSYGKTSTKFVLNTLLSQKYNVLATPASFNTPMGLTRVIRERLQNAHQVFIGEMGARHVGEIKELCSLVKPTIGILTSVGPQHLDTFGSLENIKKTKYELIDALPDDGLAVFLNDGGIVSELYQKTAKPKLLVGSEGADAWAEDVRVTGEGSSFILHLKGEEPLPVRTSMLGRHNVNNILLAAAVSKALGLSPRQIAAGVSAVEPVEHRMKIVARSGGVTVIDDAFNTNPRSSAEALQILKEFEGRRIIVTPGMVELGAEEARYNEEFGARMAEAVDMAMLIGVQHAEPIRRGLLNAGFPKDKILTYDELSEAVAMLNKIRRPGDVILYENDLPDNYSEK